jgi:hypothetical protein
MPVWPRRLLAVPTSMLRVDPQIAASSPKGYSSAELAGMVNALPEVYRRVQQGASDRGLLALRHSQVPAERAVGDAYMHFFDRSNASDRLAASVTSAGLTVDRGNHRIRAAQRASVPVMPVWVSAPSPEALRQVEASCDERIRRENHAPYLQAHAVARQLPDLDRTRAIRGPERDRT